MENVPQKKKKKEKGKEKKSHILMLVVGVTVVAFQVGQLYSMQLWQQEGVMMPSRER